MRRGRSWLRWSGSAAFALGVLSCAAVVSFDDYSPRATPPALPERYFVRGSVSGLEDAEVNVSFGSASLVENTTLQNGPFVFPLAPPDAGLLDRARFSLQIASQPIGRFCAVERSFGSIDGGDAVGTDIACSRAEPELTDLTFRLCEKEPSDGGPCDVTAVPLTPAFVSGHLEYTIRARDNCDRNRVCLSVVATARYPTTAISVRGISLTSGRKQDLVLSRLTVKDRTMVVDVTAPDGVRSARYVVNVDYLGAAQ